MTEINTTPYTKALWAKIQAKWKGAYMYDFECTHCASTKHPNLIPFAHLNYYGTEEEYLLPCCEDCGEALNGDQQKEFYDDLNGSSL